MDYMINFPNLGIHLSHVGKNVTIGGFTIAYYGIIIAIGMLIGIYVATLRAEATGQKGDDYIDIAVYTMVFGVLGARIYYVAFSWDAYKESLIHILNIREGGLAIYGGIIGGVITIGVLSKIKKIPFPRILDTIAMSVPIGQIVGRWGNFFNREAFGDYTNNLFAMQLPVSAVRQHEITETMWQHAEIIDGIQFIQVHPTFLYESVWNIGVLIILFLTRNKTKFSGELFLRYLAGYGLGRFFIERLRTDQLKIPGTEVPVSMALSAVLVLVCTVWIIVGRKRASRKKI